MKAKKQRINFSIQRLQKIIIQNHTLKYVIEAKGYFYTETFTFSIR